MTGSSPPSEVAMNISFKEADCAISSFRFGSGEVLPTLRMHYRTLGTPMKDAGGRVKNAVLMLHGTTGSGKQFTASTTTDFLFGPGQPLDADKYFIILPDAIGHGGSSRPSDGLAAAFPKYTYGDMVRAQHHLVTAHLGLPRLRLLLGTSMGGMQTWMWGQRYPDLMDALMPIACLPERVNGRNLLWRRILIEMIRADPAYQAGAYRTQPSALGMAWNLFGLMADAPGHLRDAFPSVAAAVERVHDVALKAQREQDANDVIWEFEASRDYDPAAGLEQILAPVLAVNFADDGLNPPELGVLDSLIKRVPDGRAVLIPSGPKTLGHQTLHMAEVWGPFLRDILDRSISR